MQRSRRTPTTSTPAAQELLSTGCTFVLVTGTHEKRWKW